MMGCASKGEGGMDPEEGNRARMPSCNMTWVKQRARFVHFANGSGSSDVLGGKTPHRAQAPVCWEMGGQCVRRPQQEKALEYIALNLIL